MSWTTLCRALPPELRFVEQTLKDSPETASKFIQYIEATQRLYLAHYLGEERHEVNDMLVKTAKKVTIYVALQCGIVINYNLLAN